MALALQQSRRRLLRSALVAVLTTPFAQVRAAAGTTPPAVLTISLDQWAELRVQHRGQVISFPVAEVFRILQGD